MKRHCSWISRRTRPAGCPCKNEAGGVSVYLVNGDDLNEVPDSHRTSITPVIREVFVDPPAFCRRIADRTPFPHMATWLRALAEEEIWALGLHHSSRDEWTAAGFTFWSDEVFGAEITPSDGSDTPGLPPTLRGYYSLVDRVSWMPFGCSGGLSGRAGHDPLTTFGGLSGRAGHVPLTTFDEMYHGRRAGVEPEKTFVFGSSSGGDLLLYTADDRGGWLCHENGWVHLLGTIRETIDWVYAELLANRSPDFDYGWLTPDAR
jgi:hypothetical protein